MIRIALTGPESCGKSTLAAILAKHYKADLVEEYAREYITKWGGAYERKDMDEMARTHHMKIKLSQNSIQIIDTDFIVFKVWSEHKYNKSSKLINELVDQSLFDLHILCTPDIPWEEDPIRENPRDREYLFGKFEQSLQQLNRNFIIVNGSPENRLEKSILAIDALLN
jgi:NadR type nicotinamide-nucleotide adenylyltransferase